MSDPKQQDFLPQELLYFLAYDGSETVLFPEDEVLKAIASLAIQLKPFHQSFSGMTTLRKLLECKEAYKRALIITEAQTTKSRGTYWIINNRNISIEESPDPRTTPDNTDTPTEPVK